MYYQGGNGVLPPPPPPPPHTHTHTHTHTGTSMCVLEIAECLQLVLKCTTLLRLLMLLLFKSGCLFLMRSKHYDYSVVTMSIYREGSELFKHYAISSTWHLVEQPLTGTSMCVLTVKPVLSDHTWAKKKRSGL